MGQIDSGSKSNRLLASRRYTHNTFNTAQESFTNVLDLRSEEIYTRAHLIPSSSLPHSGSSQKMAVFSKSGQNVTKYWYRHKLTKSNTNNEVWFFLNPTGSDSGVGAQLINDNQEVNFISPKYGTSALANATAEDSTPGYLAVVYKSTATNTSSLGGGDIVSTNDYQFDYKTGVLQFKSGDDDPTDSQYLYMSVYQYVGQNLRTGLEIEGPFTASNMSFGGDVTGSSSSTGSFGQVFVGDRLVFKDHQDSGEYIESDGTDLSINVGGSGDINIPANIGMTFGDDGEKIEGDGTDLTIASSRLLNLSATTDVVIPTNVGLHFTDSAEKIESDGTDFTFNSGNDINLTATTDVNIPANVGLTFGNDGEKIEGDGTDLTIAGAKINLTAESDVYIPQNIGLVFDANGSEKIESDDTDLTINSGAKINLTATSDVHIPNNVGIVFGGASEKIEGDGTDLVISANNLTVDAAADIILDAGGNDTVIKSGGTTIASFKNASSDFVIVTDVDDKDIIFKGQDSTSEITALTLDMSAAGLANFNNDVVAFYSSDERLKDNVVKIGDPLMKLSELRGVEFDWNDNKEVFAGEHSYGVIAQEVEKVLPEIVTERGDGYKAVKYELIVPLLIESIKELHKKVEHIEKNCECLNK